MSALLKGPWSLCYDGVIEDSQGDTVICLGFDSYREFNQQSDFDKAKQRAITAAPELLRALVNMNRMGGDERGGYCICPQNDGSAPDIKHATICVDARNAIAKATGAAA